ncbi:MAG: aminopeptidase P family protein [Clostridia bacterium]|nr:aminopeptidase P family protein [Clostridia bacterium]
MNKMELRYAKLREKMNELGLDAIYVNSAENHLYVTDFDNPDGYAFLTKDAAWVFADSRYIEAAKAEATPLCTVCLPGQPALLEIVKERGIRVIGYEDRRMTCAGLESLKKSLADANPEFAPVGGIFTAIRSVKTPDEVENIVAAQRIAEGAFQHIVKVLTHDMTEIEVAAELEYYMKKNGSQKPSFDTIAVSGSASSRPHGVPRPVKLEKGFLTMDYGAMVNGYHSDMTRTVSIGKADDEMKRLYDTVLKAQCAAIDAIGPGKKNADMDKLARDIIDDAGYKGYFSHSLGHGVGLEIHEDPGLHGRMGDAVLLPGQIVTSEPGIYIEGKYGCRIEDMVLVTEDGRRDLTDCPKMELIEL